MRECGLDGRQGSLAGDAGHVPERIHACPSVLGNSTPSRLAASCRIVVVVAQPFTDVTWRVCSGQGFSDKTASVFPAGTIRTSMSSGPRSMLKAIVNVVISFALPRSWACFAPRRPHPTCCTGRRRLDVSSMFTTVCAVCVLVHEPVELDEQLVRVALLQSRAVELLQALGVLLGSQAHATQESLHPALAGTGVEFL